jgi:hypothetical protein
LLVEVDFHSGSSRFTPTRVGIAGVEMSHRFDW